MKKWKDRKDLVFPYLCLVRRVEKWMDEIFIYLVEIKNKRMKNKVDINLLLCSQKYIKKK